MMRPATCATLLLLLLTWSVGVCADEVAHPMQPALDVLRLLPVQYAGRVMPLEVMSRALLRELAGREDLSELAPPDCGSADAVFTVLSLLAEPERWTVAPIFNVPYRPVRTLFGEEAPERVSFEQVASLKMTSELFEDMTDDPRLMASLQDILARAERLHLMESQLALFPLPGPASPWVTCTDSDLGRLGPEHADRVRTALTKLVSAFRARDAAETHRAVVALVVTIEQLPGARHLSSGRVRLELLFARLQPLKTVAWAYVLPLLLAIASLTTKRRGFYVAGVTSLVLAFLLHTAALAGRSVIAGRLPLANTYEYAVMTAWGTVFLAVLFEMHLRRGVFLFLGALLGSVSLAVAAVAPLERGIAPLMPALRSVWLQYHVLTVFIGYAAFLLACAASVYYLVRRRRREPEAESDLLHANDMLIRIGFLFLTLGIITGCIWANISWGRYWGWDAKEVWALITWFVYVIYLHLGVAGWKRPWLGPVASCVGFAFVVFTYLGVTYLLSSLHSYVG